MGIRQLPSGAFQVRFQHHRTSYVATYPTRELAEEAEPLLRAAVLTGQHDEHDTVDTNVPPPTVPATGSRQAPTPEQARASSAAAAPLIGEILADVVHDAVDRVPQPDQVLTTGQAAVLLGVSRPIVVSWLEAGRIPFHWRGTHRRVHRSDVLAYRDLRRRSGDSRQLSRQGRAGSGRTWPAANCAHGDAGRITSPNCSRTATRTQAEQGTRPLDATPICLRMSGGGDPDSAQRRGQGRNAWQRALRSFARSEASGTGALSGDWQLRCCGSAYAGGSVDRSSCRGSCCLGRNRLVHPRRFGGRAPVR